MEGQGYRVQLFRTPKTSPRHMRIGVFESTNHVYGVALLESGNYLCFTLLKNLTFDTCQ